MGAPDTPDEPIEVIQKLDDLIEQCRELTKAVRVAAIPATSNTNKLTIGSTNFYHGAFVGFCIATCLATWVALLVFDKRVDSLQAWSDIYRRDIGQLVTRVNNLEKKP
jgi:hypothetical protein